MYGVETTLKADLLLIDTEGLFVITEKESALTRARLHAILQIATVRCFAINKAPDSYVHKSFVETLKLGEYVSLTLN